MIEVGRRRLPAAIISVLLLASCATVPPPHPVASTDAFPYLEKLEKRRALLAGGLVASMDLDFRDGEHKRGGKVYLVLAPQGRFRMEVPGFMGSTLLVMTCDGETVLAYYPEDSRLYRADARGPALSELLPVPLPVAPYKMPDFLMGTPANPGASPPFTALRMSNGDTVLALDAAAEKGIVYTFHRDAITMSAHVGDGVYTLELEGTWPHYPAGLTFEAGKLRLKGRFHDVRPADALSPAVFTFDPPADSELVVIEPGP